MKQKVVLVLPNFRWRESVEHILWDYVPYGLCMLAAVIEHKYDVAIIDAYKKNMTVEEFTERIIAEKPDVVGVTALMDYFGPTLHKAAALTKKIYPNVAVIAGGVYATTNIERVLSDKNIDYLIAGEGEYALLSILENIFQKNELKDEIPWGILCERR